MSHAALLPSIPLAILLAAVAILSLLLALPAGLLCLQLAAALWPRRAQRPPAVPPAAPPRPRLTVLVPAHNEESGIALTLASIQQQLAPGDDLLVIADNCSDHTAEIAFSMGAAVTLRHDPRQRSKAAALVHGLRHLAATGMRPELLILVDADCWLDQHALDHLAARCVATAAPVQALYLMHAAPCAGPARRAAAFAWRVKNHLRALGRHRLGMPCQLSGSGMAFPAALLAPTLLDRSGLVEDLELGLALAAQGHAPAFCAQAVVHSLFPDRDSAAQTQRTRWEHGHLHLIRRDGARHLWRSLRRRDWPYAALAWDLCVPPLSLLLMLGSLANGALLLACALSGAAWPWLLATLPFALLLIALLAAWHVHGRDLFSARQLLWRVPVAMLGKLPLYLRFLRHRQREWIASVRERR